MKKLICAAAVVAAGMMSLISFGGCKAGSAHVEYTLSEDGTYYIVSGVSGDKQGLTRYEVPAQYSAEEGGELLPVKEIGYEAFFRCGELVGITLPDTIERINVRAFAYCGLTSLEIPDRVTAIDYAAFGACKNLRKVTVPKSVTSISSYAFSHCINLESAYIKAEITVLEDSVFYNSVVSFGGSSYSNTALKEVYLPATLEKININALRGNSISDIYFAGSEEQWNSLYFYDMVAKEDNKDEYEEKKYSKKEVLPSSVTVHFNSQF